MKRLATLLVLLAAALAGGAYWLDLTRFTDLQTGFVAAGPLWVRYLVLFGVLALCGLAAFFLAAQRPAYLRQRCVPTGVGCFLGSLMFALVSGSQLPYLVWLDGPEKVLVVLYLFTALWLVLAGVSRLWKTTVPPTGSALWGVLGSLSLYLLTMVRFGFKPSGLVRVAPTVQVFSVLAALLFFHTFLRALYLPGAVCGRALYFTGCAAFFLCTCLELPQTVLYYQIGMHNRIHLLVSASLGVIGLLGGISAVAAAGEEAPVPQEEMPQQA